MVVDVNLQRSISKIHEYLVKSQSELMKIVAATKGMTYDRTTAPFRAVIENNEYYTRILFDTPAPKVKGYMDSTIWRDMFFAAIMEAAVTQPVKRYKNAVMFVTVYTSSELLWDLDHFPLTALVNALKISGIIQEDNYSTLSIAIEGVKSDRDEIEVIVREKDGMLLRDHAMSKRI